MRKSVAIHASKVAVNSYASRRIAHTESYQPTAAVGGFPYAHRTVAQVDDKVPAK